MVIQLLENAKEITINGKMVKSIVLQDGGVLYEKENINREPIILKLTGTDFSNSLSNLLTGENIIIDWGDGTTTNYTSGGYSHTYDVDGEHTITVLNVTAIGNSAFVNTDITEVFIPSHIVSLGSASFAECDLLDEVTLSEGLTSIGDGCFSMNPKLTEITIPSTVTNMGYNCFSYDPIQNINLLWESSEDIIEYWRSIWGEISTDYTFTIPEGTTQLYVDKGYPLAKLVEGATSITLTSDKDIVGVGETAILTALLLPEKANETIYINKIINDENLVLELTSTRNRTDYTIKAKVIDEDDNGLENIRIKLFKEE